MFFSLSAFVLVVKATFKGNFPLKHQNYIQITTKKKPTLHFKKTQLYTLP